MEIDLHIHSQYSPDSRSKPDQIVKRALELSLGAIAVTDHSSWKGWLATSEISPKELLIVPGAELKTERGDLLALFVREEVRTNIFAEAVDAIHNQGGLAIVPHPGVSPRLMKEDVSLADGLEIFNATVSEKANGRAVLLAKNLGKPGIASSDAHLISEIGNGATRVPTCTSLEELRHELLRKPEVSRSTRSNPLLHKMNAAIMFGLKGIWQK
ncbi:MAG: PHP domain-containing protein [Candidatus Thermoplasmatota archaeon]|nr:PHP domain-containing protein [Candidatus Thermoplasmatota archaeon]